MGVIITRSPQTRQPRTPVPVAPLAGLRNLWNFGDGTGGKCRITGTQFTFNTAVCSFKPDGTLFVGATGSTWGAYAGLNWTPQDCTIIIGYRLVSGTIAWSLMDAAWNGWYDGSSTWTQLQTASSDFAGSVSPVAGGPSNGPVKVVAMSCATNDFRASLDGGPVASDTSTTRPTLSSTPYLKFGADYGDGNRADVYIQFVAILDRTSSDAELRALSGSPWSKLATPLPRRIWVPSAGGGNAYTLTAAAGSYSLTGQSAALVAARKFAAAQGAYALTGQATGLKAGRKVVAAQGAYSLTGQAAGLRASRSMAAAQGSYALTGQAAGFLRGRALLAAQGAYALTGQAAGLRAARKFAAAQGAYALNGQLAALNYSGSGSKTLLAGQGSYTLNGQALNLRAARRLPAVAGAYSLAGQAVALTKTGVGYTLTAAQGAYAITGTAVGLRAARRMAANYGTYQLAGQVVTLSYSGVVPPTVVAMSSAPLHRRADGPGRASQLSTGRRVAPPNGYRS